MRWTAWAIGAVLLASACSGSATGPTNHAAAGSQFEAPDTLWLYAGPTEIQSSGSPFIDRVDISSCPSQQSTAVAYENLGPAEIQLTPDSAGALEGNAHLKMTEILTQCDGIVDEFDQIPFDGTWTATEDSVRIKWDPSVPLPDVGNIAGAWISYDTTTIVGIATAQGASLGYTWMSPGEIPYATPW